MRPPGAPVRGSGTTAQECGAADAGEHGLPAAVRGPLPRRDRLHLNPASRQPREAGLGFEVLAPRYFTIKSGSHSEIAGNAHNKSRRSTSTAMKGSVPR